MKTTKSTWRKNIDGNYVSDSFAGIMIYDSIGTSDTLHWQIRNIPYCDILAPVDNTGKGFWEYHTHACFCRLAEAKQWVEDNYASLPKK